MTRSTTTTTTTTTTPTAPLDQDLSCEACGYNLRGLRRDGRCPECGRSIADTYYHHVLPDVSDVWPLTDGDTRWLTVVTLGVGLLLASALLVAPIERIAGIAAANTGCALALGRWLLECAGLWLITWPAPRAGKSSVRRRWVIRIGALAGACSVVAAYLGWFPPGRTGILLGILLGMSWLLAAIAMAAFFLHVRGLAIRARSTALAVLASIMIVLPLLAWPFCLALELGNWLRFNPAQRLLALPSVPFASHAPLMDVLVNGLRGEAIVVGYTPALALLLLTLMLVKLLIEQHRLLRVRASDAGKTPASSHP